MTDQEGTIDLKERMKDSFEFVCKECGKEAHIVELYRQFGKAGINIECEDCGNRCELSD